jgi:HAD superfamily hydrolase (TIGR01509 family)
MPRCIEIVTEKLGRTPPDDLLPRFFAAVKVALEQEVTPVTGVVEVLDALDAAGIPHGVASNGEYEKMHTTLGTTGLLARLDGRYYSAVDVARPKPAPDLFLLVAQQLGLAPARTLVVEDSPLGVLGAHAAGMTVIGYAELVSPERLMAAGADHTIHDMRELLAFI